MYQPKYSITSEIARSLMRIEASKQSVSDLPITPQVLASLRETARLQSTHYSTMIEGNKLADEEVRRVIQKAEHISGKERDIREVKGYFTALNEVERLAKNSSPTEAQIQKLHALVEGSGSKQVKPTAYRSEQNVIRDSLSGAIVYLPPEAHDVPELMHDLFVWIKKSGQDTLPAPLMAAIAHYQYVTIHPYLDGNGRTARLLTTLIAHQGGYGLKGVFSLEEYYARDLQKYYDALALGLSHNYYFGRHAADITPWVEYFCAGMANSFESIKRQAQKASAQGQEDQSHVLRELDARKRQVLELFVQSREIATLDIARLFHISPRAARKWCQKWVNDGFFRVADPAQKSRKYALASKYEMIVL